MFQKLTHEDLKKITALEIVLGALMITTMLILNRIGVTEPIRTGATVAFLMLTALPIHYSLVLNELRTDSSEELSN